jgi:GTP-binding protein EngB required for normal cell division
MSRALIKYQINDQPPKLKKLDPQSTLAEVRAEFPLPSDTIFLMDDCELDINDEDGVQLQDIMNEKKFFFLRTLGYRPPTTSSEMQIVAVPQVDQSKPPPPAGIPQTFPLVPGSMFIENRKGLKIYKFPHILLKPDPRYPGARVIEEHHLHSAKYVIMLGQTGTGKTTTINAAVNYLQGVHPSDDFRYELIVEDTRKDQSKSQTSEPNIYCVPSQIGYPWTIIIDTPGYGDTGGMDMDAKIDQMLYQLFKIDVSMIHLICFVIKASVNRIGAMENYVYGQVLKLFGKDVADNFLFLITFCDGGNVQAEPSLVADSSIVAPIIKDLQNKSITWNCKFNNSAVFQPVDMNDLFSKPFWDLYQKGMHEFFHKLCEIKEKSLTMTNEVIFERAQLDTLLVDMQSYFQKQLAESRSLKKVLNEFETCYASLESNSNFEIETSEPIKIKQPIKNGTHTTYCTKCDHTCHRVCQHGPFWSKLLCECMSYGSCVVCPGKCGFIYHSDPGFTIEQGSRPVKKTMDSVKKQFDAADSELSQKENIVLGILRAQDNVYLETLKINDKMRLCINKLSEIALRPNCFSTTAEYIKVMIANEESSPTRDQSKIDLLKETQKKNELADKSMAENPELAGKPKEKALEDLIKKGAFRKTAADVKRYLSNK